MAVVNYIVSYKTLITLIDFCELGSPIFDGSEV